MVVAVIWLGVGSVGLIYAGCAVLGATELLGLGCADATEITGDGSLVATLALLGGGFAIGLGGIWLVVKLIHKKRLLQVVTGRAWFDINRYFVAIAVGFIMSLALFLVKRYILDVEMTFERPGWEFVAFVVVALVLVPLQAGFEEVFYRGYLMQGLLLVTKSKAVLVIAIGALFAVTHLTNPEADTYGIWIYVIALTSVGAFYALVTLFDGGIELAAGYHMISNLFMGVVSNTEDAVIETPALFTVHSDSYELFPNLALDIVIFAVAIVLFNSKYKWTDLCLRKPRRLAW